MSRLRPSSIIVLLCAICIYSTQVFAVPEQERTNYFPNAYQTNGIDTYLKINSKEFLNPSPKEDFLISFWFRLKNLPKVGEKVIFISKYNEESKRKEGYAIGIEHDRIGLRPVVYWKAKKGKGGWFAFQKMDFSNRDWVFLALSYTNNRFISLNSAVFMDNDLNPVELLGGYDLGLNSAPDTNEPLRYGFLRNVDIKGRLGPLGVFSDKKLSSGLPAVLSEIIERREDKPDLEKQLKMWIAGDILESDKVESLDVSKIKHAFPSTGKRSKKKS